MARHQLELSPAQIKALRIIANNEKLAIPKRYIDALIDLGYITPKFGGGWMANSKGRTFIKNWLISTESKK